MKLNDFPSIVGQIKQAREGCEHLMPSLAPNQSTMSLMSSNSAIFDEGVLIQKQEKYLIMWNDIMELATNKWDLLNQEYLCQQERYRY